MNKDQRKVAAEERKSRVFGYMTGKVPLPIREISAREGSTDRTVRRLIKELEQERGVIYTGWGMRYKPALSDHSYRLRAQLADRLHRLKAKVRCSERVSLLVGLNTREQVRAANRPFAHDWTLSQIERLGQALECSLTDMTLN